MIPFLHGAFAPNGAISSAYELIESQTVGAGGSASITFTVPAGYQHLQVRGLAKTTLTGQPDLLNVKVNSDAGANYSDHVIYGDGSSALADKDVSRSGSFTIHRIPSDNEASSVFGGVVIDVLDYSNTSKNKTARALAGFDANGSGRIGFNSGAWYSTSAITSLVLSSGYGYNLKQYSTFSLYGIKGA